MTEFREKKRDFHGRSFGIESGKMAKQAGGSVLVKYGDTRVLVTAVSSDTPRPGADFLPLTVDYQEMTYAAGKIPGGFFKREGRPSEREILTCRIIDRPVRPLLPKGYYFETQIVASVLSIDQDNDPDIMALTGASCALCLSDVPFAGPIAAVRVGRIGGEFIFNPSGEDLLKSDMDLFVAGSRDDVVMVEGRFSEIAEDDVLSAIVSAHRELQPLIDIQLELMKEIGKPKRSFEEKTLDPALLAKVEKKAADGILKALAIPVKQERYKGMAALKNEVVTELAPDDPELAGQAGKCFDAVHDILLRKIILDQGVRIDGRKFDEIRSITCEVGILPRTHGSALFTRGETQVLASTTLGTSQDEQKIDALRGESYKTFMLHYNFPPFSVGEAKPLRGPTRREIGHGALAERAISSVLPKGDDFPYTIRIVSDVLESNGSSSMATVCGSSLCLMDAGVPVKAHVAGIAMGLVKDGDKVAILSDIMGDEDHAGDMDFKVAGTANGITALQMDIKIKGVGEDIMKRALNQARDGRQFILGKMSAAIDKPRPELSPHAPRIVTFFINPDKIRDVIGPGGKVIRKIVSDTGVKIEITDDGKVEIASTDEAAADRAINIIKELTKEAAIGEIYEGKVVRVVDFGAFVEILPGVDGLVHISQLTRNRVNKVTDVIKEGDTVRVKVIDVDKEGRIKLSRKEALVGDEI
jgi:polyribonucleotide nucleotidyltransferase